VLVIGLRRGICGEIIHALNERRNRAAANAARQNAGHRGRRRRCGDRAGTQAVDVTLPLPRRHRHVRDRARSAIAVAVTMAGSRAVDGVSSSARARSMR